MAININTTPSQFSGITSFPAPSVVSFPPVGNAAPIQIAGIWSPVNAPVGDQQIYVPVAKDRITKFVIGLGYAVPGSSGVQVAATVPNSNALAERYPMMPPSLLP
jgi:hypothetical protein